MIGVYCKLDVNYSDSVKLLSVKDNSGQLRTMWANQQRPRGPQRSDASDRCSS